MWDFGAARISQVEALEKRVADLEYRLSDRQLRFDFATREDLHVILDVLTRAGLLGGVPCREDQQ